MNTWWAGSSCLFIFFRLLFYCVVKEIKWSNHREILIHCTLCWDDSSRIFIWYFGIFLSFKYMEKRLIQAFYFPFFILRNHRKIGPEGDTPNSHKEKENLSSRFFWFQIYIKFKYNNWINLRVQWLKWSKIFYLKK